MAGQVLVHLEHGHLVLAEDPPELVVGQDFAAVLRVLQTMRADVPYSNMALDADLENGPPPGTSPPMRMTASWSGSKRTYRIQVRGVKMRRNGEFPSHHTQIGTVATRAPQEKPVSLFILPPRAQA